MVLQISLQRRMVPDEFLVIDQRRILAKLIGDFAVAIQKLIKACQFLTVDVAVAIALTAIITVFLMQEGIRGLL